MIHSMIPHDKRPSPLYQVIVSLLVFGLLAYNAVLIDGRRHVPEVTLGPPVVEAPAAPIHVPKGVQRQYLKRRDTIRLMFRCGGGDWVRPFLHKLSRGPYELWVHTAPCWGT